MGKFSPLRIIMPTAVVILKEIYVFVKVESGKSDIKLSTLISIINLLGVDLVLRKRGRR